MPRKCKNTRSTPHESALVRGSPMITADNSYEFLKLYVPIANNFFVVLKKTELDYDTGIFMRLWKNFVSSVLSTKIQL